MAGYIGNAGPDMSHVICHFSHVTCHMSHVTCHRSHVSHHLSHATIMCHLNQFYSISIYIFISDKVVELICEGSVINGAYPVNRAPENLKLAGNRPKMAAMCSLKDYTKKQHIFVVFKLIIPITMVFMHLFWTLRPIWLAFYISGS